MGCQLEYDSTVRNGFTALWAWLVLSIGVGPWSSALAAPPVAPDPRAPGLDGPARVAALAARIAFEQARLHSLEADFVQLRTSEMLNAPERSSGVVSFASPDRVRWDYGAPLSVTLVLGRNEMLTWYRDLRKAERVRLGKTSNPVARALGVGASLATLKAYFTLSFAFPESAAEPYRVELAPRSERLRKRLSEMTLWIDPGLFVPRKVRFREAGGDVTEIEFTAVRINPALPADRFDPKLPPDVEVRTGGAAGGAG
jgi:outer membrane lipoprotein-sorting protein